MIPALLVPGGDRGKCVLNKPSAGLCSLVKQPLQPCEQTDSCSGDTGKVSCAWMLFACCELRLHLSVPAQGSTTKPRNCDLVLTNCPGLFELGPSPCSCPSHSSQCWHTTSIAAAAWASQCILQHPCPQASLIPCEGWVLKATVRSCEELI